MAKANKSLTEDFDASELLALARLALERGDIESALAKLKTIIAAPEPLIEALAMAARVYAQLGLYDRAEALYERYLEKQPNAIVELFQLGMTRFDAGKASQAVETWERVLKDQPTYPPALFYKSLALAQAGKAGEAKQILEGMLKTVPADNLYFGRGKELLQHINSGVHAAPGAPQAERAKKAVAALPEAYRTEH